MKATASAVPMRKNARRKIKYFNKAELRLRGKTVGKRK
jgi:hypothetical protein